MVLAANLVAQTTNWKQVTGWRRLSCEYDVSGRTELSDKREIYGPR